MPQNTEDQDTEDQDTEDQELEDSALPPALSGQDLLLWSAIPDLTLNIAQTAALCGITVRQLGYWTKQGYVTATGRGSRRLYGPASLRRILAIRQSMTNGLSLRQSLRAVDAKSSEAKPLPAYPQSFTPLENNASAANSPSAARVEAVCTDLLTLMQQNQDTRDSAGGLATKLGRAEPDVRHAADHLAAHGMLQKSTVGSEAVYCLADGRSA